MRRRVRLGPAWQQTQRIQRHRRPDRTAGQRRQRRMYRMTEPYAVERVDDAIAGTA